MSQTQTLCANYEPTVIPDIPCVEINYDLLTNNPPVPTLPDTMEAFDDFEEFMKETRAPITQTIDKDYDESLTVTWEIVCREPGIHWNLKGLSANPNIDWEIVRNNQHLRWDYDALSANPNITQEIVNANQRLPWNLSILKSRNISNSATSYVDSLIASLPSSRAHAQSR